VFHESPLFLLFEKLAMEHLRIDSKARIKEKKKWQIAFRRYVLDQTASEAYAYYFGLDRVTLRKWIEIQFFGDISWENFGTKWQFDHIVPVAYFDLNKEEDLRLCWSFLNIRVEPNELNKVRGNRVDVLGVRSYFNSLYKKTKLAICLAMLQKIDSLEISLIEPNEKLENFLLENNRHFDMLYDLTEEEFHNYNAGMSVSDIMLEREILRKFSK
jgi:hypothetical protein